MHHTAFICAEIAAKQGHGDVSMLTPTNIAIEVLYSFSIHVQLFNRRSVFWPQILNFQALLKIGSFVTEDPTTNDLAGNLQADSQSCRMKAL